MRAAFLLVGSGASALLVASCGSSAGTGGGVGMNDASIPVPADAFVMATVGPVQGQMCPYPAGTQSFLGQAATPRPTTVTDGTTLPAGDVTVVCSVRLLTGDAYELNLLAEIRGAMGGSFQLMTGQGPTFSVSDGAQPVIATFSSGNLDFGWSQNHPCGLTFTYQGKPVPDRPALEAGRLWGHVSCPTETPSTSPPQECDLEVDFLFENCRG